MLSNVSLSKEEEDVSFNVESLFTNIPVKEITEFICDEVYNRKKVQPVCKESIFKKLLYKITTECTFSLTGKLRKQIDGVVIGGTLSVTLSGCFMNKMEKRCCYPSQTEVLLSICTPHM